MDIIKAKKLAKAAGLTFKKFKGEYGLTRGKGYPIRLWGKSLTRDFATRVDEATFELEIQRTLRTEKLAGYA